MCNGGEGSIDMVVNKIRATRVTLLKWQHGTFGGTKRQIEATREKLRILWDSSPTTMVWEERKAYLEQLNSLLSTEEWTKGENLVG